MEPFMLPPQTAKYGGRAQTPQPPGRWTAGRFSCDPQGMKIATWNVNSVKARLEPALAWLKEAKPDVVCLQEIKSVDEGFPRAEIEALGYNIETHGQKSWNGVAILSLIPSSSGNSAVA